MRSITFLLLVILGLAGPVQAQSALNAAGRTISPLGAGFLVEYALGEVATLPLTGSPGILVTQGVLQPSLLTVHTKEAFDQSYSFRCFPNPTTGFVTIETDYPDFTQLQITDLAGRLIREDPFDYSAIDCSSLPPGVFIARLSSGSKPEVKTFQIIKQ